MAFFRLLPLLAGAALFAGSSFADDRPTAAGDAAVASGQAAGGFVVESLTFESTSARDVGDLDGLVRSLDRARDNGMTTTRPAAARLTLEEAIRRAQWRQSVSSQLEAYWR